MRQDDKEAEGGDLKAQAVGEEQQLEAYQDQGNKNQMKIRVGGG